MSLKLSRRSFMVGTAAAAGALATPWVAKSPGHRDQRPADHQRRQLSRNSGPRSSVTSPPRPASRSTTTCSNSPRSRPRWSRSAQPRATSTTSTARTPALIESYFNTFDPLNSYFTDAELADFFPVTLQYLKNPKTDQLAAIPRNVDARTQFYRKDVYDENGLSAAVTWDDLVNVSQKITGNWPLWPRGAGPGRPCPAHVLGLPVAGRWRVGRREQPSRVQLRGRHQGADLLPRPHPQI